MKRVFAAVLCVSLGIVALLCGCTPAPKAEPPIVICTIGDTQLFRSDYVPVFSANYQYYSQQGVDFTNAENLSMLQELVFDLLVDSAVIEQQAALNGVQITAEEEAAFQQQAEEAYALQLAMNKAKATTQGAADVDKRAQELLDEDLSSQGYTTESFKAQISSEARRNLLYEKLFAVITANISLTEADAQKAFDAEVQRQKAAYTANPAQFEAAQTAYESQSGPMPYFVPQGFVRVKHILVADEATSNSLYERLQKGEDFDALMAEYGTDPGMKTEPNMSLGYLLGESTSFIPEFKAAALELQNIGDITKPVGGSYGFHIIKLVSKLESKTSTWAEVKDNAYSAMQQTAKQEAFQAKLDAWKADTEIVSYIGRIRDLGKGVPAK